MPTTYIKKLAKLNHTTVNKIEKFWSQAKEIAKSEGNGKAWGLITTIFQNKLKKEGYKVKAFTSLGDTDEYDDADLGINVDPKEYHKQKSLQMSLRSKLDMIKKDINKETDKYNKKLVEWSKELNKRNREHFESDNRGDKWLKYKGPITEKVLIEAFVDGFNHDVRVLNTNRAVNIFKKHNLPGYLKLLNKEKLVVYRGIDFLFTINPRYNKGKNIKDARIFKYLKYNLMDRNSWSLSKDVAEGYLNDEEYGLILKMTCSLEDVNLPLSAWLEGNWYYNDNQEINIRKSFKIKDIKCVFMGSEVSKYYGITKESFNKVTAFKEETREVDDSEFIFKRLSLSDCVKQIKYLFDDYFNFGKKDPDYYEKLYNTKVDESTASDLLPSDDFTVYIEYNDGSKWYSVADPKLKDLKLTGIKNCIIEYPAYTAYFGKDCRIERFDDSEDAPYVVKCEAKMNNKLDYINQVKDCIKKIWARGTRNQQEFYAKDWTARYSRIIDDCINAFEEPKVCARMMYIKYHKENPQTRDLNKNHDTDFYTLLKEAKQYFESLKKWKEDDELLNELNKQITVSTRNNKMNKYSYKGQIITASSKQEAIKIFAGFKTSKQIWQVAGELSDSYKEYKNTLESIVKMLSSYKSKKLIDVRQLKDSEITDSGMSFSFIVETKRNKKVKKFIWNIKNKEYGCEMNLYYGNEKDKIENMDSVGSKKTLDTIKNFIFGLG